MDYTELPPFTILLGHGFFNLIMAFLYYDPDCPASIHTSFLLMVIIYFLTMIVRCFQESFTLSLQVRYKLNSIEYGLFGPVASGITIRGAIWWFVYKTSSCNSAIFGLMWLFLTFLLHLEFSRTAYEKFQIWWDIDGLLDTISYHPNRDFHKIHEELMIDGQEMEEIRAGLLQADHEEKKQAGPLRNVMREKTCPICCVDFEIGEKVVDVPNCLHTFHKECIVAWLEKSSTCPMCRGTVRKTDQRPRENRNAQQDLENGQRNLVAGA